MVSDIHFDPFWDPGKVPQLAAAPVDEWRAILAAPASPNRAARFKELGAQCAVKGDDTSFPLYENSLAAMRKYAAGVKFITVAGDLMAHKFDCKFDKTMPHGTADEYRAFSEKTVAFAVMELKAAFPAAETFPTLGNNDSGCGDYKLDADSTFLKETGEAILKNLPTADYTAALKDFAAGGNYSAALPAPIRNARLLAIDDMWIATQYTTCGGKADAAGPKAMFAWLHQQLAAARAAGQKVWVVGHIPPVAARPTSLVQVANLCTAKPPEVLPASSKLAEELGQNSDVIQLALFAHTHMDEMMLLRANHGAGKRGDASPVAVKLTGAISPVDGNTPSFTVAQVDPSTAVLVDYAVFAASDASNTPTWSEEYDYAKAYGEPAYTGATLKDLISQFAADPSGASSASQRYIHNFKTGSAPQLQSVWPEYVCAMANNTPEGLRAGVCPAGH